MVIVVVMELEREKAESFASFESEFLPANCSSWLKVTSAISADFVKVYSEDFRTKLAKELADLQQEQRESLECLKEASTNLKEPSHLILKHLNILLAHFSGSAACKHFNEDPWINELAVRHNAALFLDQKAKYLNVLYRIYTQIKHLHVELSLKLNSLSEEYFRILERFGMSAGDDAEIDNNIVNPFGQSVSTWDDLVLKQYSLDYDWKLECPPLDGFLSSLFSNLKSLGASLSLQMRKNSSIPKIFSDQFLRIGFLQKSVSGLLSRSWQVYFVVLQPSTGFLHFYKTSTSSGTANLLVPAIGTPYTKNSLQDLNLLAIQFFLQNPHQPAHLSPQILAPSLSFALSQESKVVASDPETFTLVLRPNSSEKVTLRAFCEEEFVDWVIFLNEVIKLERSQVYSPTESPRTGSPRNGSPRNESPRNESHIVLNEPQSQSISAQSTAPAPIVDLENPWN